MPKSNIEEFEEIAGRILENLFSQFPKEATIKASRGHYSEYDLKTVAGTFNFLKQKGLITFKDRTERDKMQGRYFEVALTDKGSTLLGYTPDFAQDEQAEPEDKKVTFGSRLKEAVEKKTPDIIISVFKDILVAAAKAQIG